MPTSCRRGRARVSVLRRTLALARYARAPLKCAASVDFARARTPSPSARRRSLGCALMLIGWATVGAQRRRALIGFHVHTAQDIRVAFARASQKLRARLVWPMLKCVAHLDRSLAFCSLAQASANSAPQCAPAVSYFVAGMRAARDHRQRWCPLRRARHRLGLAQSLASS